MKKVIFVIGMLFCVLGNAQRYARLPEGTKNDSIVTWRGSDKRVTHLKISDLAGFLADQINTGSTDNQNISGSGLNGDILTIGIQNGGSQDVDLSSLNDSGTDNQDLSISDNRLLLRDGGEVDLSFLLDNTDDQVITSFSLNTATNIISLLLEGDTVKNIDLSSYLDNTDSQTLSLTGQDLTISGGNTITLPTSGGGGTDTNTKIQSVDVTGSGTKTITITDTDSDTYQATFTDLQGGGGSSNPNEVVPTTQSDLEDINNAGKIFCLQNDITLTSDITIADSALIRQCGGKIIVGSNTITFQNNSFSAYNYDVFIDLGQNGSISDSSTFSNGDINLNNFGVIPDGNIDTNTGTDNRNAWRQAQKIYNITGGHGKLLARGVYMVSVVDRVAIVKNEPTNFYITGKASFTFGNDAVVKVIPNDLTGYDVFSTWNSNNTSINGGLIVGDLKEDDNIGASREGCHGIYITANSENVKITTSAEYFPGDGAIAKAAYEAIFSSVNSDGISEASFLTVNGGDKGFIIEDNGTITANPDFAYSNLFSLSNVRFAESGYMTLGGDPNVGGQSGFKSNTYYIAFYDNVGTFIERTDLVERYVPVELKPEYDQFRVIINTPDDYSILEGTIFAPVQPKRITFAMKSLAYNKREGISNPSAYSIIEGIRFYKNGRGGSGELGSPGFGINFEDGAQMINHTEIRNNWFGDNARGAIIVKGAKYLNFHDNWFEYENEVGFNDQRLISLKNCTECTFEKNTVKQTPYQFGRGTETVNNKFYDSEIVFTLEDEIFKGNYLKNSYITTNVIDTGSELAYFQDNHAEYDKPLSETTYVFNHVGPANIIWKDNVFDFKNHVVSSRNRLSTSVVSGATVAKGYVDGLTIKNIKAIAGSENSLALTWPAMNINNLNSSISFDVRAGLPQDLKFSNSYIEGYFKLTLNSYPDTNGGDSSLYSTYTVDNTNIVINNAAELNAGTFAVETAAKDVNYVMNKGSIEIRAGDVPNSNKFLQLPNFGTKDFIGTRFYSDTPNLTVDLTGLVSGDKLTFTDCIFENGLTFIIRPGDEITTTSGGGGTTINNTDDLTEGSNNLYYTETRVSANTDVTANTAKVSFPEAPQDGNTWGRNNTTWTQINTGSSNASDITVTTTGNLSSTNAQSALQELQTDIDALQGATPGAITTIQEYNTVTDLPVITGSEIDTYAFVTSDPDQTLKGLYTIAEGNWVMLNHFEQHQMPIKKIGINEIDLTSPDIEDGQRFVQSGDGQQANALKYLTNFIPVRNGERLGKVNSDTYRLYYADKTPIPFSDPAYEGNLNDDIKILFDYVAYARWSCNIADKGVTDMIVRHENKILGAEPIGWADYHGYERDNERYVYETNGRIWKKYTNNIFRYEKIDHSNGVLFTGALNGSFSSTEFIPCKPKEKYSYSWFNQSISFFDSSKTFVSGQNGGSNFTIPDGVVYFKIVIPRNIDVKDLVITRSGAVKDVYYLENSTEVIQSDFQNTTSITLVGDSIGTEGQAYATNTAYGGIMAQDLRLTNFNNVSSSGDSFATFNGDIDEGGPMPTSSLYVITLGTNDFRFANQSITAFNTNINGVVTQLLAINPDAKIAFITPILRDDLQPNSNGHTLDEFADAIINYAVANGHFYFDAFREMDLDPRFSALDNTYFDGPGAGVDPDGLHPNDLAHSIKIYPAIAAYLKTVVNQL